MKRIFSFILCLIIICISCISTFGAGEEQIPQYICKTSFEKQYTGFGKGNLVAYREMYVHHTDANDSSSEVDWVFVLAYTNMEEPMRRCGLVGDRLIFVSGGRYPFTFGYCVYDAKTDEFIGIADLFALNAVNNYDGLLEYYNNLELGIPLGDSDRDGELTILDATYIQRAIAGLCEFKVDDDLRDYIFVGVDYVSDFDRDGERTVLDATAIQLKLAKK